MAVAHSCRRAGLPADHRRRHAPAWEYPLVDAGRPGAKLSWLGVLSLCTVELAARCQSALRRRTSHVGLLLRFHSAAGDTSEAVGNVAAGAFPIFWFVVVGVFRFASLVCVAS